MKHRAQYEIVYRQLCNELGKPIPEFKFMQDWVLLEKMNILLGLLNCQLLTANEITKSLKA